MKSRYPNPFTQEDYIFWAEMQLEVVKLHAVQVGMCLMRHPETDPSVYFAADSARLDEIEEYLAACRRQFAPASDAACRRLARTGEI